MSTLPDAQIAQLIRNAGASESQVPTMVAIALAESGGDPHNLGDVGLENATWGPSVGLWQIRSLKSQYGTGGVRDEKANYDPATNAAHAMAILHSQGLSAWSTYTDQKYRLFMNRATNAASSSSSAAATDVTTLPVSNPVTDPFGWLAEQLQTINGYIKRGAAITAGGVLVLAGGYVLAG